jgi:hypothetical protein
MVKKYYEPPKQSGQGQVFDSLFLLIIIYAVLLLPLVLGLTAGKTVTKAPENITWETLGQNPVMQKQWEHLGMTAEDASEYITARFDYTINPIALLITAVVIIGYFVLMLRLSDKEYRDVIREKFD